MQRWLLPAAMSISCLKFCANAGHEIDMSTITDGYIGRGEERDDFDFLVPAEKLLTRK
jgi:hypothetical protein